MNFCLRILGGSKHLLAFKKIAKKLTRFFVTINFIKKKIKCDLFKNSKRCVCSTLEKGFLRNNNLKKNYNIFQFWKLFSWNTYAHLQTSTCSMNTSCFISSILFSKIHFRNYLTYAQVTLWGNLPDAKIFIVEKFEMLIHWLNSADEDYKPFHNGWITLAQKKKQSFD